ncbi:PREDICTED: 39S ribosomal protein L40, mitochondrial [Nanorana parkeri]|uniref:39S ribosomal protein L40, mitochondrial n=1 Tax=Nanorana parkeri TaxID=125878 RepID=UPI00085422D5|nr:PREDICTED: 39S ribosomal protein L40, mitochondrial [Nanorana parkeri]
MNVAACSALLRVCRQGSKGCPPWVWRRESHWQTPLLGLRTNLPMRAEPKKKKKVDPKRDQIARERLKKKLKKLERIPAEFIPIEDFIPSTKLMEESRIRSTPRLSVEEQERRALLIKQWARVKKEEHEVEQRSIETLLEAQRKALDELRFESEELYQAAVRCDPDLFPMTNQGPYNTAPIAKYNPPDGKYNDITKVYVQQ